MGVQLSGKCTPRHLGAEHFVSEDSSSAKNTDDADPDPVLATHHAEHWPHNADPAVPYVGVVPHSQQHQHTDLKQNIITLLQNKTKCILKCISISSLEIEKGNN